MTLCRTIAEVEAAAIADSAREDQPLTQAQVDFGHALVAPYREPSGEVRQIAGHRAVDADAHLRAAS